ncbi:MAG: hypothetical protein QM713_01580 [Arachnia sp.]
MFDPPEQVALAWRHFDADDYASGMRLVGGVLARNPQDVEALHAACVGLLGVGRPDDAVATAERLVAMTGAPRELITLMVVLEATEGYSDSAEVAREVLPHVAEDGDALARVAGALSHTAPKEAVPVARAAEILHPGIDARVPLARAFGVGTRKERRHAEEILRDLLSQQPAHAEAHELLADLLGDRNAYGEALATASRGARTAPADMAHLPVQVLLRAQIIGMSAYFLLLTYWSWRANQHGYIPWFTLGIAAVLAAIGIAFAIVFMVKVGRRQLWRGFRATLRTDPLVATSFIVAAAFAFAMESFWQHWPDSPVGLGWVSLCALTLSIPTARWGTRASLAREDPGVALAYLARRTAVAAIALDVGLQALVGDPAGRVPVWQAVVAVVAHLAITLAWPCFFYRRVLPLSEARRLVATHRGLAVRLGLAAVLLVVTLFVPPFPVPQIVGVAAIALAVLPVRPVIRDRSNR